MGFEQESGDKHEREQRDEGRVDATPRLRKAGAPAPPSVKEQCHAGQNHRPEQVAQEEIGIECRLVAGEQLYGHDRPERVHQQQQGKTDHYEQVSEPAQLLVGEQPPLQQHVEEEGAEDLEQPPAGERRGGALERRGDPLGRRDVARVGTDPDAEPGRDAPGETQRAQDQGCVQGSLENRRRHDVLPCRGSA